MPRTRKTVEEQIGLLSGKKSDINKRIETLRTKQNGERRKLDTRRKAIVGGSLIAHSKRDAEFSEQMRVALRKAVAPKDRAVVADLM